MPLTPEEEAALTAIRDGSTTAASAIRQLAGFLITALKDNETQQRLIRNQNRQLAEQDALLARLKRTR